MIIFSFLFIIDIVGSLGNGTFFVTLGGDMADYLNSARQTSDGGYITTGQTSSYDVGGGDILLSKFSPNGTLEFMTVLGEVSAASGQDVIQTADGCFAVAGYSDQSSKYGFLLVKYFCNGTVDWTTRFLLDGYNWNFGISVEQTTDDGYILCGYSYGIGFDREAVAAKIHTDGTIDWVTIIGRSETEEGYSITQTLDSGYIMIGKSESFGDLGVSDALLVKISNETELEWAIVYGESSVEDVGEYVRQTNDGGYVTIGRTNCCGGSQHVLLSKFSSNGTLLFSTIFGGSGLDYGIEVQETRDGGFITVGHTTSFGNGNYDVLLAKFFANGTLNWASTLGGSNQESGNSVEQTEDGEFVIGGSTSSYGYGGTDCFLSTVSENGEAFYSKGCEAQWERLDPDELFVFVDYNFTYVSYEYVEVNVTSVSYEIQSFSPFHFFKTDEVGIGNQCNLFGDCYGVYYNDDTACSGHGDCSRVLGECSCWNHYFGLNCNISECNTILSNDSTACNGRGVCVDFDLCNCSGGYFGSDCELRQHASFLMTFGGVNIDKGYSISQTEEGGYILAGQYGQMGDYDVLLSRFAPSGELNWTFTIGGSSNDVAYSVQQTKDGGFVVAGATSSFGAGDSDLFLIKFSDNGSVCWATTVGGSGFDEGRSVQETEDGGFVVTGFTVTFGAGNYDILLVKFHSNGSTDWIATIGGSDDDRGLAVQEEDGGEHYIVTGYTKSMGIGNHDVILLKVTSDGSSLVWTASFGGDGVDVGYSLDTTPSDGGIIVTGSTTSFGEENGGTVNVLLAKFLSNGDLDWAVSLDWSGEDTGYFVQQTLDSGYIVTGTTDSYGAGGFDIFLAKFFYDGTLEWASTFGGDMTDVGRSVQQTFDGGFVVTGDADYSNVFIAKTYLDGEGCGEYFKKISGAYSSKIINVFSMDNDPTISLDHSFSSGYITLASEYVNTTMTNPELRCSSEFVCFGKINAEEVCSGHGNCSLGNDLCSCDKNYFGIECENHFCFDIPSNSSVVCSGHGTCISHNVCLCSQNYSNFDCSIWKCFGIFANDTERVCHGELTKSDDPISHGNCTSHDTCECEEGYQRSTSCDWDCFGEESWLEVSCGGSGTCVDHNNCSCFGNYTFKDTGCFSPICAGLEDSHPNVCSGHGTCIAPDFCLCNLGYQSTVAGHCGWFTCFGIEHSDSSVCSSGSDEQGECVGFNLCKCLNDFLGDECETWECGGVDKDDSDVCSGNGVCTSPSSCDCKSGFTGVTCGTNSMYYTIMLPVFASSGSILIISFIIVSVLCCCCLILVCCVCVISISGLSIYVVVKNATYRKFKKLKNVDILLREQEAEDDISIAHLRVKNDLLKIPISEIRVKKILGEGGSNSTVYLALWKKQQVAFKCFRTRMIFSTQDSFNEFEREAEIHSSISHPNVVRFFGCSIDPPRVGILMEFCEKGECFAYMKSYEVIHQKVYPLKERLRLLFEVCCGMAYLHNRGVVHRDLKCENALLNRNECIKLVDFGIARISKSAKMTKGIGTSEYMAPEVVLGNGHYNEKCDVFSFGIMSWIVVSIDEQPYGGDLNVELKASQNPAFRPGLEKLEKEFSGKEDKEWVIKELMVKCWEHNPDSRPSFDDLCNLIGKKIGEGEWELEGSEFDEIIDEQEEPKKEENLIMLESLADEIEGHSLQGLEKKIEEKVEENRRLLKRVEELEFLLGEGKKEEV